MSQENRRSYEKLDVEKSLRLIDEVQKRPVLWQKKHKEYKNLNKKNDAWAEIAANENISLAEAKCMWKKLLGCYRSTKAKVRNSLQSGAAHDEVYNPKWFGYHAMAFVGEATQDAEHVDTLGDDDEGFTPRSLVETSFIPPPNTSVSSTPSSPIRNMVLPTTSTPVPVREGNGESEALPHRLQMPGESPESATPDSADPEEFAKYVANVLRTFPERKRRRIMDIQRAILEVAKTHDE